MLLEVSPLGSIFAYSLGILVVPTVWFFIARNKGKTTQMFLAVAFASAALMAYLFGALACFISTALVILSFYVPKLVKHSASSVENKADEKEHESKETKPLKEESSDTQKENVKEKSKKENHNGESSFIDFMNFF